MRLKKNRRNNMTREERIRGYEEVYDEALMLLGKVEEDLAAFKKLKEDLASLEDYYSSGQWIKDFEADEAGKLPSDLKRGVLSEDGIYNLLDKFKEIKQEYSDLVSGE
jgi:hypothetical protein